MSLRRKFENVGIMAAPAVLGLGFLVLHHMPGGSEVDPSVGKPPVVHSGEGLTAKGLPPEVEKLLHQSSEYTDPYDNLPDKIACYMTVLGPLGAWALLSLRKPEKPPVEESTLLQAVRNIPEQVREYQNQGAQI